MAQRRDRLGRFAGSGSSGGTSSSSSKKAQSSLENVKKNVQSYRARINASAGSPTLMRKNKVITRSNLYIPVGTGGSSEFPRRKK